jgi:aspartokinase
MDMLLSVGERIAMSLMAMAIEASGKAKAISYTGSQVGIITDRHHTDARIIEIRSERIRDALNSGKVVVVAGFQGVSVDREITTLGRGGSDTTAVALAAALNADHCDLIKEVPGIFSSDPTIIPEAVPIPEIDYESVEGLSLGGARILKKDCIELARKYGIELRVGTNNSQTIVKQKTTQPFFSIIVKEGFVLIPGVDFTFATESLEELEMVEISGIKGVVCYEKSLPELPFNTTGTMMIKGLSKMTAVGENAGRMLTLIDEDEGVEKVICKIYHNRTAKAYFTSKAPLEVLNRIHTKMLKKATV